VVNRRPYADSGREVDDGQGCNVLSDQDSDGSGGVEKATRFIVPDSIRLLYMSTAAPETSQQRAPDQRRGGALTLRLQAWQSGLRWRSSCR
jgi:hypothetical protein